MKLKARLNKKVYQHGTDRQRAEYWEKDSKKWKSKCEVMSGIVVGVSLILVVLSWVGK